MLVHMSAVCTLTISVILDCQLRLVVFGVDQRNCIKFYVKYEIKCSTAFEMLDEAFGESTMNGTQKFICGITGLRKAEKISMTMLILVARACQQPMKTLKQ